MVSDWCKFLFGVLCLISGGLQCEGKLQGRVINGYSVDITYFPFVVSLQVDDRHICGATIVSKRVLVTAAHCDVYPSSLYRVRLGSTFYNRDGLLLNVSQVIKHPKYNRKSADYDVAIITLQIDLNFQDSRGTIAALPLPPQDYEPPTGLGVIVLGWGTTNPRDDTTTSSQLQSASLRVISQRDCVPLLPPGGVTERMICAQNYNLKQDACTGDSGGPLYGQSQFLGIISWGIACADGRTPGVYTNIVKVLDFIQTYL